MRFHGELPKEEVARLMRDADLFVLPSLHETFGCVLIEAMASGLPSVATRVGGVPEVLPGEAGELVAPQDPQALAAAIERGLERPRDPAALARTAAERYGYEARLPTCGPRSTTSCCRAGAGVPPRPRACAAPRLGRARAARAAPVA